MRANAIRNSPKNYNNNLYWWKRIPSHRRGSGDDDNDNG